MKPAFVPALTLLLLAACDGRKPAPVSQHPAQAAEVKVQTVSLESHQATEDVVGTVRSKQQAVIEAKVSGRVLQYLVAPGQTVKAGEMLASLDVQEIRARLEQAKAGLEQAEKELARYKQLIATNAVGQQEFDAAEGKQKVAKAALNEAETMLGYARVTAPFDGVITRKLAEVGDLAMPGKPLMEIEAPSSLRFEAGVPEAILDRIKLGTTMAVKVSSLPKPLEAVVSEIAPVSEPSSRTFLVKFDLPTVEGLRTGQFGRVSVPIAETKLLRVQRDAILKRGQMEVVFVVRDQKATLRLVKTGKTIGGGMEILSGLEEGEQVVISNVARLTDGQPLTVKP
jgi:RND family efflux transporter MFP subunit